MRIALLVANPYRDLSGLALVASRLCRDGATCYLVPKPLAHVELARLAPDFVLLENLRPGKQNLLARMDQAGIRLGVLETEGGVYETLDRYLANLNTDPGVTGRLACFCTWGEAQAESLARLGLPRDRIRVTGQPRFDFYAPAWREAALRLCPYTEGLPRPLLLVNGSFNFINPWSGSLDTSIKDALSVGAPRATIDRWIATEREAMSQMIACVNGLARTLPDAAIVYRPHPFEDPRAYDGRFDSLPNLRLVKAGTVEGWILRAAAVVQRSSSTAIEAAMAGVPTLSTSWIPARLSLGMVEAAALPCASLDQLLDRLRDILRGQHAAPAAPPGTRWILSPDGRAHERVAAVILESRRPPSRLRSLARPFLRRSSHPAPPSWQQNVQAWESSERAFTLDDVGRIAGAIAASLRASAATEHYLPPFPLGRSVALTGAGI